MRLSERYEEKETQWAHTWGAFRTSTSNAPISIDVRHPFLRWNSLRIYFDDISKNAVIAFESLCQIETILDVCVSIARRPIRQSWMSFAALSVNAILLATGNSSKFEIENTVFPKWKSVLLANVRRDSSISYTHRICTNSLLFEDIFALSPSLFDSPARTQHIYCYCISTGAAFRIQFWTRRSLNCVITLHQWVSCKSSVWLIFRG